jgi:hypothetical protein
VLNGRKKGENQRDISLTLKKSGVKKSYGIGLKRQTVIISMREENELNLRNQTEFRNPFTRLQLFANSFFPFTIKSWNKLSPQLRNAPTLNRFKQANKNHTIKPPNFTLLDVEY